MSDYNHILVAIDFSVPSGQILNKARDIASRNNAKLSLLHVIEYVPPIDTVYEPVLSSNWIFDETEMLAQAKSSMQAFGKKHQLTENQLHTIPGTPQI